MSADMLPVVHHLLVGSSANQTWRSRGASLDPRRFAELLRDAHHSAVGLSAEGQPIALYELLSVDLQDGHAELSLAAFGSASPVDVFLGAALFIEQCFDLVPIRQLYAFVAEGGYLRPEALDRFGMRHHGALPTHVFLGGRYRDLQIYCLRREDLAGLRDRAYRPIEPSALRVEIDEIILSSAGVALGDLDDALSLDDAHLDSLALAEVLAAIEDAVGHCLEPAWVDQIETVAEFRAVVDQVLGP